MMFQGHSGVRMGANYQRFGGAQLLEGLLQPLHTWVKGQPAVVEVGQLGMQALIQFNLGKGVLFRYGQWISVEYPV